MRPHFLVFLEAFLRELQLPDENREMKEPIQTSTWLEVWPWRLRDGHLLDGGLTSRALGLGSSPGRKEGRKESRVKSYREATQNDGVVPSREGHWVHVYCINLFSSLISSHSAATRDDRLHYRTRLPLER